MKIGSAGEEWFWVAGEERTGEEVIWVCRFWEREGRKKRDRQREREVFLIFLLNRERGLSVLEK